MVCVSSGPLAFKQAGCCITRIDDTWYVFGCLTIVLSGTWVLDVEFPVNVVVQLEYTVIVCRNKLYRVRRTHSKKTVYTIGYISRPPSKRTNTLAARGHRRFPESTSFEKKKTDRLPQQIAGWWVSLGKDSSYPVVRWNRCFELTNIAQTTLPATRSARRHCWRMPGSSWLRKHGTQSVAFRIDGATCFMEYLVVAGWPSWPSWVGLVWTEVSCFQLAPFEVSKN